MKRRSFIKIVGGTAGACALGVPEVYGKDGEGFPQRTLGRTGAKVSIVGFPGLALANYDQERGSKGVKEAFEKGITYFDVAPAYGKDGDAEKKLGVALQGIDRDKIFLACKTKKRDADGAREELERSLQRLKTDRFDLYQLHHLVKPEEVKQALGPGGAMETVLKAKAEGKIRFIGFSAHTTKAALEALNGFKFDTVMFPINFVEYFNRGYGKEVLELARQQGAGVLALKPMSFGAWAPNEEKTHDWWYRSTETAQHVALAWRFTLSQPGVAAGIPPSFLDLLDKAIEAGKNLRPVSEEEIAQLKEMAKGRGSIFEREEKMVAMGLPHEGFAYPPAECAHWRHV